jgi:hypothetical protein
MVAEMKGTGQRSKTMAKRRLIDNEIRRGLLSQGYELQASDVGHILSGEFGQVIDADVGKRVWLRSWGIAMENNEQRDARKAASQ